MYERRDWADRAPMTHTCNPRYSRGRDQEDRGSKPAQVNSSQDPVSKKTLQKNRADGVTQGEGPEFKTQNHTHTKKRRDRTFLHKLKNLQTVLILTLKSEPTMNNSGILNTETPKIYLATLSLPSTEPC
jgi:hypothetical protein